MTDMNTRGAVALAAFFVAQGLCPPASAVTLGASRAWVSGHGVDQAGCGAPATPCRSLQYAHDNIVFPGGEIDILDPAGYGAITITKAISIVNDGVGTAGVQTTSGNAIEIDAGPTDAVYLKGLNVDGVQSGGQEGVLFNSGGALTMVNCTVRHFAHTGVWLRPSAGSINVFLENVELSDNGVDGFRMAAAVLAPTVAGELDRVIVNNNGFNGIEIGPTVATAFTITNSIVSHNASSGIVVEATPSPNQNVIAIVESSTISANAIGIDVVGSGILHLGRSVIDENTGVGVESLVQSPGAAFSSGDNDVHGNFVDVNPPLTLEPHS